MSRRLLILGIIVSALLVSACGQLTGGGKKLVITEGVCGNVRFLRMKIGQETNIVLDNSKHSTDQDGMSLVMTRFPVTITGDIPPNTEIGSQFTTFALRAAPGETASVSVKPLFAGEYNADCNISIDRGDSQTVIQKTLTFQIVAN